MINLLNADYLRDNSANIVLDTDTNLMWNDDSDAGTLTASWLDAITYCETKNLAGYDDWSLPNFNELFSIIARGHHNPALVSTFQNSASFNYWSSTTYQVSSNRAWRINFDHGHNNHDNKNNLNRVRCVRVVD